MTYTFKFLATIFTASCLIFVSASAQESDITPVDFGDPETLSIETDDATHNFLVEIADSDEEQSRGMMYRDSVSPDTGMLFEYADNTVVSIWMKNTGVPLDIIFIRTNGKILKIEHSATPYSLRSIVSEGRVSGVLELAGGRSMELGIMPGDIVRHEYFGNLDDSAEN
ncbi:MAG: DUF192 domain-containing protein [Hellea sp.]|nr:DUF192 domain-containing protein [Hellea sp.]